MDENKKEMLNNATLMVLTYMKEHPEIEGGIWLSALVYAVANVYHYNKVTYNKYVNDMNDAMTHYKKMWVDE